MSAATNPTDTLLPPHRLSVVVPLYNEAESVPPLVEQIHAALAVYPHPWELILVDDGSADATLAGIEAERARRGDHVRVVALQRNHGQTAAMQAGIDAARGEVIATLDGDLQNDPADILPMAERLFGDDLDLLVGWRRRRQDKLFLRKIPSRVANRLIGNVTGVRLHDYGCSLKLYRTSVIRRVRLYGEMHRFIPAWAATATTPARIGEMEVRHHARKHGKSKYGLSRMFKVLLDLLAVYFFMRHRAKPGHFFGLIGLHFGFWGGIVLAYLAVVKFGFGQDIGTRPLLLIGVLMIIAAFQFITTGVVAEIMSRTYYESADVKPYELREAAEDDAGAAGPWAHPVAEPAGRAANPEGS